MPARDGCDKVGPYQVPGPDSSPGPGVRVGPSPSLGSSPPPAPGPSPPPALGPCTPPLPRPTNAGARCAAAVGEVGEVSLRPEAPGKRVGSAGCWPESPGAEGRVSFRRASPLLGASCRAGGRSS